jgi:histidinol phosphatase-like enzyme (inositol monophosphatase family)
MTAPLNAAEISDLTSFAEELADLSGKTILPHFREKIVVHNKHDHGGFDPVTEADREAERVMRARIKLHCPSHGILGEEHGHERGSGRFTWVLDPIDGTRAFMCGMAQWGTLIALNDGQRPIIGVMDQPYLRERWVGANGQTHFRHAHGETVRLKTRPCVRLEDAVLSTTSPVGYFDEREQRAFWAISGRARLTRFGGDCYAYGLLAMGFIDVIIEATLKPWDIQALMPIVENAGGVVTTWEGGPAQEGGRIVACGDARLHAAVLEILSGTT